MSRLISFAILLPLLAPAVPAQAQGELTELARRLPPDANTIALINVQRFHDSELAKRLGSMETHKKEFEAGLISIPPNSTQMVSAAEMDFEYMRPEWEAAVANFSEEVTAETAAVKYNGKLDQFGDTKAVLLPRDTYLLFFDEDTVGAVQPGHRQGAARWAAAAASGRDIAHLSPYLQEAVAAADGQYAKQVGTVMVMAMDLEYVVHPDYVEMRLNESDTLANRDVDKAALAAKLASIRGVTLGVIATDALYGTIKVDFGEDIAMLEPVAKQVLLEALGNHGAMIDDFDDWEAQLRGDREGSFKVNHLVFHGKFTSTGIRQVLSLVMAAHVPDSGHPQAEAGQPLTEEQKKVYATQNYFTTVSKLVSDFKHRKSERKTQGQMGVWMDRYAGKIDNLPLLNVDPEMIEYGNTVADLLRGGSSAIRSAAVSSRNGQISAVQEGRSGYYSYGGAYASRWGRAVSYGGEGTWWRPYNLYEQGQVRTQIRTQNRLAGNQAAVSNLSQIDQATAQIRQKMTQKYGVEFEVAK